MQRLLPTDDHLIVKTDSSDAYFTGTLSALRETSEVLLFTVSKAWSDAARSYHTLRKELIAQLIVLGYFKNDLIGIKTVDVYTDNPHVAFIMKHPERVSVQGSLIPRHQVPPVPIQADE